MGLKKGLFLLSIVLLAIIEISLPGIVQAAKINGQVYDFRINKLNEVIVFVDSEPAQRYIVKNGTYFFDVPIGSYTVTARTFNDTDYVLGADENIIIKDEGSYIIDLILSPVEKGDTVIITKSLDGEAKGALDPRSYSFVDDEWVRWQIISFAALISVVFYIVFLIVRMLLRKRDKSKKNEGTAGKVEEKKGKDKPDKTSENLVGETEELVMKETSDGVKVIEAEDGSGAPNLPDNKKKELQGPPDDITAKMGGEGGSVPDGAFSIQEGQATVIMEKTKLVMEKKKTGGAEEAKHAEAVKEEGRKTYEPADDAAKAVLEMIRKNRRITQKDIRKQMPDSEAKISLVLSELESKGIIKKIKKGRGNIIIYNEP